MTQQQIKHVENVTGWAYHENADGKDARFDIATYHNGMGIRRVALYLQRKLKLVTWADQGRDAAVKLATQRIGSWAPSGTKQKTRRTGTNDKGHIVDFVFIEITPDELPQHISDVQTVVSAVSNKLHQCGVL